MDFGHWNGREDLKTHLVKKGHDPEEVGDVFPYDRKNYKVVFPYRNHKGEITGLWGRIISKVDGEKYKPFTRPAPKSGLFNLNKKIR